MSTIYWLRLDRIYLNEEVRRQRKKRKPKCNPDFRIWFYKDILKKSFSGYNTVADRLIKRRESLEKCGYFKDGEITEKGLNKLIDYIVNTINRK